MSTAVLLRSSQQPAGGRPQRRCNGSGWRALRLCLAVAGLALAAGTGCSSLRVVEGNLGPPKWVADPSLGATNLDPKAFVFASGISTYSLVLEEGIADARHDAIRKIVEGVAIAADDVYQADRTEKRGVSQSGMPNVPQFILNSRKAVRASSSRSTSATSNPQAMHISHSRLHEVDQVLLTYSVWQYGPSLLARLFYGDTTLRFYDVYVLMRCPKAEFDGAIAAEKAFEKSPDWPTRPEPKEKP